MDNQQATLTDMELGWLGGVVDSDGCISMSKSDRGNYILYGCDIVFTNTDPVFIEEVARLLNKAGVGCHVRWTKQFGYGKKRVGEVRVGGHKRCFTALSVLQPGIRAKSEQARYMLEFLTRRLAVDRPGPHEYTREDHVCWAMLKALKERGASETIREPVNVVTDDIVQANSESVG